MKTEKEKNKPTSPQSQENAATSAATSIQPIPSATNVTSEASTAPSTTVSPQPPSLVPPSASTPFSTAVSMLAPLPSQNSYTVASPQAYTYATSPPQQLAYPPAPPAPPPQPVPTSAPANLANDRWENMATLFQSIRDHARNFEYPGASVAALETILIRLYLESPVGMGVQSANMSSMMPTIMAHARDVANNQNNLQPGPGATSGSTNDITSGSTAAEEGG